MTMTLMGAFFCRVTRSWFSGKNSLDWTCPSVSFSWNVSVSAIPSKGT